MQEYFKATDKELMNCFPLSPRVSRVKSLTKTLLTWTTQNLLVHANNVYML